jgi:hypothetical protein
MVAEDEEHHQIQLAGLVEGYLRIKWQIDHSLL